MIITRTLEACSLAVKLLSSYLIAPRQLLWVAVVWLGVWVGLSVAKTLEVRRGRARLVVRSGKLHCYLLSVCIRLGLPAHQVQLFSSRRPVAVVSGLLSPKITVSTGLVSSLERSELEAVLLHERYHLEHGHVLLRWVLGVAARTVVFLPSLGDVVRYCRDWCEFRADRYASRAQGTDRFLRQALAKSAAVQGGGQSFSLRQIGLSEPAFAAANITERVGWLSGVGGPRLRLSLRKLTVSGLIVLAMFAYGWLYGRVEALGHDPTAVRLCAQAGEAPAASRQSVPASSSPVPASSSSTDQSLLLMSSFQP
ncbi:MAG: hypothetical protein COU69_00220 [Candidatus Pacebacteria bacterium CG10_big_fil_rev_8_21_14_0_10_56_10]|nr:MAG: hypothetical protein COU69_00220 [Candidatus Pacebacteria bacterium CG10_big_fil_rev_8_21_14_0_10_56_10]